MDARQRDHPPGGLGEELRADRRTASTRSASHDRAHKTQIARAVEEIFDVSVAAVRDLQGAAEAEAPRPAAAGAPRSWKKAIVQLAPGERIELFEGAADCVGRTMPNRKTKPTSPGRRFATYQTARGAHRRPSPEAKLTEGRVQDPAAATPTAASPRAIAAAAQSAATARSTSSAARTACRPRSPRSSTTRTASASIAAAPLRRRREALHPRARSG